MIRRAKSEGQGPSRLAAEPAAPTSEHVVPGLLGLEVLQPVQVLLAVVEVVLEGAVAVVTEVTLPHGPAPAVPLPGEHRACQSREWTPHPEAHAHPPTERSLRARPFHAPTASFKTHDSP